METDAPGPGLPGIPSRTADELFADPQCTHIVTMNNSSQNVHIERVSGGFRMTFGSLDPHPSMAEYDSLDGLYQAEETISPRRYWRGAIWHDISDYPPFTYGTIFRLLDDPVQLVITPDSEHATPHGPHAVYGPVEIAVPQPHFYFLTPTAGWLVVEYPDYTMRGRGGRMILRSTHGLLDRLRLRAENRRLRRDKQPWTRVKPGATVVYGKPPADWRSTCQILPADQPAPAT